MEPSFNDYSFAQQYPADTRIESLEFRADSLEKRFQALSRDIHSYKLSLQSEFDSEIERMSYQITQIQRRTGD